MRKKENGRNPLLIEDPEPDVEMVAPGIVQVHIALVLFLFFIGSLWP